MTEKDGIVSALRSTKTRDISRGIAMARGDQLGRQWKIIQTLISSQKGKSASELAQELDCHPSDPLPSK